MKKFALAMILCFALIMPVQAVVDVGIEVVFGGGISNTVLGVDTNKIYTGFQFETPGLGLFFMASLGGGYKLTSLDLGSMVVFRAAVGVGYRFKKHRVSIMFDHISNGDFNEYNPGLNVVGIRYGYRWVE